MPRPEETEATLPPPDPTTRPTETGPTQAPATQPPPGTTPQPTQPPPSPTEEPAYLAAIRGADPAAVTAAAIAALGGIERFVRSGADVIVKPNICVAYHPPEYAATTNPTVVATLVRLCLDAGARRVRVMDHPFGGAPDAAYDVSGIAEAVRAAGGEMEIMSPVKYAQFDIPEGRDITAWDVYRDVIEADVLINVPIAKHHSLARLTLGGKNLMGVITSRNLMHRNLGQRIADLTSLVRPSLTVVDAVRILTAHGPSGGDLNDVTRADTVIASADIVAADAYAATLFDLTGADISYVQAAAEMGLGTLDLGAVNVVEAEI
jgi:uncharacterized protein (DUF362 family)